MTKPKPWDGMTRAQQEEFNRLYGRNAVPVPEGNPLPVMKTLDELVDEADFAKVPRVWAQTPKAPKKPRKGRA